MREFGEAMLSRSHNAGSQIEVLMDVFQEAARLAQRRHGDGWYVLSAQEQTRAIYQEMRRIDGELAAAEKRLPRQRAGSRNRSLAAA